MNTLPDLPKQYKRKEAEIDSKVLDWFLDYYDGNVLVEVKIKGNKTLPHQDVALKKANDGEFKYKFPDMGRRTPGDGIVLKKYCEGFVVTCAGKSCEAVRIDGLKKFKFKIK